MHPTAATVAKRARRNHYAQAYMMSYHDSVEVAKFQQSASREKQAFLSLIQKKGHMVLPTDEVRGMQFALSS